MRDVDPIRGPINGYEVALLVGKTIKCASIEALSARYDDMPILVLTMTDGSVVRVTAEYGGYTGNSEDEYPRWISVERQGTNTDGGVLL
jgi:hypothetical protein